MVNGYAGMLAEEEDFDNTFLLIPHIEYSKMIKETFPTYCPDCMHQWSHWNCRKCVMVRRGMERCNQKVRDTTLALESQTGI